MSDSDALEQLLAGARESNAVVLLERRTYNLDRPLVVDWPADIRGNGAVLGPTVAMRAVLVVREAVRLQDLTVNAGLIADFAVEADGAGQARFMDCLFQRAKADAFHVTAGGDSSCMRFYRCNFEHSGRVLSQGTVRVEGGTSAVVYGTGTDFTAARAGDFLRVAGQWLQVAEVLGPEKLRCAIHPPATAVPEGTPYTLHVGDGYHEEVGAASLVVLEDCRFRGCKGSGGFFAGLYGVRVVRGQSDFNNAFGFVVGMAGAVNVHQPSFRDCYTEEVAHAFFVGGCSNLVIDGLCCSGVPWLGSNPSFIPQGVAQGVMGRTAQEGVGDAQSNLAANNLTIHNAPPSVPDARPSGSLHFVRPGPDRVVGYVKLGASPYSEWAPFCRWEVP